MRIHADGSVPRDNPFVGRAGARPEIWSYGHRNVQGATIHPDTGALWAVEHGPRGGDEVNIAEAGRNYGWPLVSWGRHYIGLDIPDPPTRPDLAAPVFHWTPVIGASGMAFYTGERFKGWRGDLLVGGLVAHAVVRLRVGRSARERTGTHQCRRACARRGAGPRRAIYVLTDESHGKVLRLTPKAGPAR